MIATLEAGVSARQLRIDDLERELADLRSAMEQRARDLRALADERDLTKAELGMSQIHAENLRRQFEHTSEQIVALNARLKELTQAQAESSRQLAERAQLAERRLGEHELPKGTWVVAAGNRAQDRALVRSLSSALVNRVTLLHVRVEVGEWLDWARRHRVRPEILSFIEYLPDALMRPVPAEALPFSTPRAWALLSRALDLAEGSGVLSRETRRALAFGRLSAEDAAVFCALAEESIAAIQPPERYIENPAELPRGEVARWFVLNCIRQQVRDGTLDGARPAAINRFLRSLPPEAQLTLLTDLVEQWGALGADRAMFDLLKRVANL